MLNADLLKAELCLLKTYLHDDNACFRLSFEVLDEVHCVFIAGHGVTFSIHCSIMDSYPAQTPLWYAEDDFVAEILQKIKFESHLDNFLTSHVLEIVTFMCRVFDRPIPAQIGELKDSVEFLKCSNKYHGSPKHFSAVRLRKEIATLTRRQFFEQMPFSSELVNGNIYEWKVVLHQMDPSSLLYTDLMALKRRGERGEIVLNLTFSVNYPFLPPEVELMEPFLSSDKIDVVGGKIPVEILSREIWSPRYSPAEIVMRVASLLAENFRVISSLTLTDEAQPGEAQHDKGQLRLSSTSLRF